MTTKFNQITFKQTQQFLELSPKGLMTLETLNVLAPSHVSGEQRLQRTYNVRDVSRAVEWLQAQMRERGFTSRSAVVRSHGTALGHKKARQRRELAALEAERRALREELEAEQRALREETEAERMRAAAQAPVPAPKEAVQVPLYPHEGECHPSLLSLPSRVAKIETCLQQLITRFAVMDTRLATFTEGAKNVSSQLDLLTSDGGLIPMMSAIYNALMVPPPAKPNGSH